MSDDDEIRKQIDDDAKEDLELQDQDADKVSGGWQKLDTPNPAGPTPVPYPNI